MPSAGEIAAKVVFCLCGPIGSLCCFVISAWGVIMLLLLGIFYYIKSVVLFEDLLHTQFFGINAISHDKLSNDSYWGDKTRVPDIEYFNPEDVNKAFQNAAFACWGAGVIYLAFLVLSGTFIGINVWRAKAKAAAR